MQRITRWRKVLGDETGPDLEIKRKIFEKVSKRINELGYDGSPNLSCCAELNPDVIVISGEQTFLFEPQNAQAGEWLRQRFAMEAVRVRDRIRVHPSRLQKITGELKAAGFVVAC